MKIRSAHIGDLKAVIDLLRQCISHMAEQGVDRCDIADPEETALRADICSNALYLIEDETRICGMMAVGKPAREECRMIEWKYAGESLMVQLVAVAPAYQRNRVATRLMGFAEDIAWLDECEAVRLIVCALNPVSTAFFTALNYRLAGDVTMNKKQYRCFEKMVAISTRDDDRRSHRLSG